MKTLMLSTLIVLLALAWPAATCAQGSGPPMSSPNYAIAWSTVEETHGGASASSNFRMETAVIGQMFAQPETSGGNYQLCTGFACAPSANYHIYLPLVLRV